MLPGAKGLRLGRLYRAEHKLSNNSPPVSLSNRLRPIRFGRKLSIRRRSSQYTWFLNLLDERSTCVRPHIFWKPLISASQLSTSHRLSPPRFSKFKLERPDMESKSAFNPLESTNLIFDKSNTERSTSRLICPQKRILDEVDPGSSEKYYSERLTSWREHSFRIMEPSRSSKHVWWISNPFSLSTLRASKP